LPDRTDAAIATDALVIGAGPVGLFQVFQLGLLELGCHVIDSLPAAGGQCIELYPDKPIYDIPALPRCTGRELVDRLLEQVAPLGPTFHLSQRVNTLEACPDGRFAVGTSGGLHFLARTVFIAGGVGSFEPRRLPLDGIEPLIGRQVFHSGETVASTAARHVVILGDDEATLQYALQLALDSTDGPASVTLMHRRDSFRAEADTIERMRAACAAGRMRFVAAQASELTCDGDMLTHLVVNLADGGTEALTPNRRVGPHALDLGGVGPVCHIVDAPPGATGGGLPVEPGHQEGALVVGHVLGRKRQEVGAAIRNRGA
jgi:thioredoxin reductase (NADPH)